MRNEKPKKHRSWTARSAYRPGAGPHADRRTKRMRTRATVRALAISGG